jgi:hypothetical protein
MVKSINWPMGVKRKLFHDGGEVTPTKVMVVGGLTATILMMGYLLVMTTDNNIDSDDLSVGIGTVEEGRGGARGVKISVEAPIASTPNGIDMLIVVETSDVSTLLANGEQHSGRSTEVEGVKMACTCPCPCCNSNAYCATLRGGG